MTDRDRPPKDDPLVFLSRQLRRQPGSSHRLQRKIAVPQAWGNAVCHCQETDEIEVDLLLESAHDGILVAGKADVQVVAECVRCLQPLSWVEEIAVQQFFTYPEVERDPNDEGDEDVARIKGDLLDLRGAFRDAVVLALPLSPVCREDCLGLCSECGFELSQDAEHHHERSDPRWSALAQHRRSDSPAKESD